MSEYFPRPGDVVRDDDGNDHTVLCVLKGAGSMWVAVATRTVLALWLQLPIDELTFVRRGTVVA